MSTTLVSEKTRTYHSSGNFSRMQRLFFLILIIPSVSIAQNLVPNSSFEEYNCDSAFSTPIWFPANHWFNPNDATPDMRATFDIDNCNIDHIYDINLLVNGEWQFPHTGDCYAGIYIQYAEGCTREYLEIQLAQELEAGSTYCIEWYASLANVSKYCSNCIGITFTQDTLIDLDSYCEFNIPFSVAYSEDIPLCDTLNWTPIQGEYVAQGGERFLTIGNLLPNDSCLLEPTTGSYPDWSEASYYFIDDISVVLCDNLENEVSKNKSPIKVFPNPCTGLIGLTVSNSDAISFQINQMDGKIVQEGMIYGTYNTIDISSLANGLYILNLIQNGTIIHNQKIVLIF